tara:strand:+ start:1970 stop:2131 length:162 start_codon:yes stop_codon:yes gene_type:complete
MDTKLAYLLPILSQSKIGAGLLGKNHWGKNPQEERLILSHMPQDVVQLFGSRS